MENTYNHAIQLLLDCKFVEKYVYNCTYDKRLVDEATQHCWLQILEVPKPKIVKLFDEGGLNKVRRFVSGIISRQLKSEHSSFYRENYNKCSKSIIDKLNKHKYWNEEDGWTDVEG